MNYDFKKIWEHYRFIINDLNIHRKEKSCFICSSVYLHKKSLVSIGTNKEKTHPLIKKFNYSNPNSKYPLHAELDGYIQCINRRLDFDTMLIFRGKKSENDSCPCVDCARWISNLSGVNIVYIIQNKIIIKKSEDLIGHVRVFI